MHNPWFIFILVNLCMLRYHTTNTTTTATILQPLYRSASVSHTSSQELEDFAGAEFYCPHTLADGSQHIRIRGEDAGVLSSVIYTVSLPFEITLPLLTNNFLLLLLFSGELRHFNYSTCFTVEAVHVVIAQPSVSEHSS